MLNDSRREKTAYDGYYNQKTGFCSYFLTFDDGASIEIMNIPEMADLQKKPACIGYSHIAFSVGSIEKVDGLLTFLSYKNIMAVRRNRYVKGGTSKGRCKKRKSSKYKNEARGLCES